jgi:hypothetical protein
MTREELKAIIFGDKEVEGMDDIIKQIMDKHGSELTEQKKKAKEAQEATSNLQKQIDEINNASTMVSKARNEVYPNSRHPGMLYSCINWNM